MKMSEENYEPVHFDDISCWEVNGDEGEKYDPLLDDSPPLRKLFVGNLIDWTSQHDLWTFFSRFGKVQNCYISRDRRTGLKRRYGFVTFQSPDDAKKVLNTDADQFELFGHQFVVAPADSWHQPLELPSGKVLWKRTKLYPGDLEQLESEKPEQTPVTEPVPPREDEDIDESKCRIHILNDDCLMHIFSFLSKRERIKIERVCKRWQTVGLDMWVYEPHLECTSLFPVHGNGSYMVPILRGLLQRCGPNLASLDLSSSYISRELNHRVVTIVAQHTPNLRSLNLSCMSLMGEGVRALSKISHQLRKLDLGCCSGAQDRDLYLLFLHCPLLESVILSHNNQLTGKCLIGLRKSNLTELILNECNNLHSTFLMQGIQELTKLETLSLNSCINLTSSDITDILKTVPQLKHLSIARYFPLLNSTALYSLSMLHDLVTLQLYLNPAVNDQVLEAISKSCLKLKKLDITGCSIHSSGDTPSLSDAGLKLLARLPCLENLSLSYLGNVTDEALDTIADEGLLKMLECRGCPTFTDAGCMRVVALCTELELFDFSGCDLVTNATIMSAIHAVKLRTNNVKLTIIAGGTKVNNDVMKEEVPLLQLKLADLCLPHLRPDFVDDDYFPPSDDDDDYDNDYYANGLLEHDCNVYSLEESILEELYSGGLGEWDYNYGHDNFFFI